jgi:hypothetical protein
LIVLSCLFVHNLLQFNIPFESSKPDYFFKNNLLLENWLFQIMVLEGK